ncbi:RNA methyltransferase [Alkalilimnicola ehrlichii MLHE-1]|nr:RNA methyltransferase [Alkalilimnicola ehrlichii]
MNPENLRIVLVGTSHPGNIGSVARAMKTMGLFRLELVAPECAFPDEQATANASRADDVLEAAGRHDNLDAALAGCGLVMGLSARPRRITTAEVLDVREAGRRVVAEAESRPVALLFGRERSGLTNAELDRCQALVHIPANPEYGSLNLAAAVQVVCHEVNMARGAGVVAPTRRSASAQDMEYFFEHLARVADRVGFLRKHNPEILMRRLRQLFYRAAPDDHELQMLRGLLANVEPHLPELPDAAQRAGTKDE